MTMSCGVPPAPNPPSGDNSAVRKGHQARYLALLIGLASNSGCGVSATTPTTGRATTPSTAALAPTPTTARAPGRFPSPAVRQRARPAVRQRAPIAHRVLAAPRQPRIIWDPIPFGPGRRAEMAAYVSRHYGSFLQPTWRLIDPRVIVVHYTYSGFGSAYATFAADTPDMELHELPGTCAHFLIDTAGTIHQLVPVDTMCRHTVGLNWTAIGVEQVGFSDAQVLGNRHELAASLRLVRWLQCRFQIRTQNVIGHAESLSSPLHHEDVAALRDQTHGDFNHAGMQLYRAQLRRLGPCA